MTAPFSRHDAAPGALSAAAPSPEDGPAELDRLRKENALLRVERDILVRVAYGYANDMTMLLRHQNPCSPCGKPLP
jgi:hypothetical protein